MKSAQAQNLVTVDQIDRTNQLVDAGVLPRGDLLEIQATNASELQNIAVLENALTISRISLAQLLLIKDYKNFDVVDEGYDIINSEISDKSVEELISQPRKIETKLE